MPGESELNKRIMHDLGSYHPVRIEDLHSTGIPDINFIAGWIESKDVPLERAPKRLTTVLKLDHYTWQQRGWHMRRAMAGGKIYVAIEVGHEFFLIRGQHAAQHLGVDWTLAEMRQRVLLYTPHYDGNALRRTIKLDCKLP